MSLLSFCLTVALMTLMEVRTENLGMNILNSPVFHSLVAAVGRYLIVSTLLITVFARELLFNTALVPAKNSR